MSKSKRTIPARRRSKRIAILNSKNSKKDNKIVEDNNNSDDSDNETPISDIQTVFNFVQSPDEDTAPSKNYNDSGDIYTLHMKILTNFSKGTPVLLTKDMLLISDEDKEGTRPVNLETYPLFTYKVEYPLDELRKIFNYKDRVDVFFNKNKFQNKILKKGSNTKLNNDKERKQRMDYNLMAMLEILFPTSFPVVDNLHTSYNYLKSSTSYKPLYIDHAFNVGLTSHVNIDGTPKTVKKVILYNDIVNHPLFREVIDGTINFIGYAKEEGDEDFLKKNYKKLEAEYKKKTLPIQYTNYEISFLNKYRSPIRIIGDEELQEIIDHKEDENVEKFYELIQYLYDYYLQQNPLTELNDDFEDLIQTGVYDLNLKDIQNPTKEVYVMLELHGGRIDDPNFEKCNYYDEELANQTDKLMEGSLNNSILVDEIIPSGKVLPSISSSNVSSNLMNPIKAKPKNELSEAEMTSINGMLLEVMKKHRDLRQGKNKNITLLDGVKQFLTEDLKSIKPELPKYNQYLQNSIPETMVKDIIKGKLKPHEEDEQISKKFSEIFKKWMSEHNKTSRIYNENLYTEITDLNSIIESEKKKEENRITSVERSASASKQEDIKIIKYHQKVYEYYLFVLNNIILSSLNTLYNTNSKNQLVMKGKEVNKTKGGKKSRKYKKANRGGNHGRKTRKNVNKK